MESRNATAISVAWPFCLGSVSWPPANRGIVTVYFNLRSERGTSRPCSLAIGLSGSSVVPERRKKDEGTGKGERKRKRKKERENTFEALFYTVGLQLDKMIYLFVCLGAGDSAFQGMFVKDYEAEFMCVELAEIWKGLGNFSSFRNFGNIFFSI